MMKITAVMVKELRQKTGAGIMECKRALLEAQGDGEQAVDALRRSGALKANEKAGRMTTEGVVALSASRHKNAFVMLELDCETDFVAKQPQFIDFAGQAAQAIADSDAADLNEAQLKRLAVGDETVESLLVALIAQLGENIRIRRFERIHPRGDNTGHYVHGARVAALVDLEGGDDRLARDVAMHVAANRPLCLNADDLDAETLERERAIHMAQARESGKPPEIIDKIVAGKVDKYLAEVSLLSQPFVKDPECSVGQLLDRHQAKAHAFYRYEAGEGLQREERDFYMDVMNQIKGKRP